jgi:hypothetical protein
MITFNSLFFMLSIMVLCTYLGGLKEGTHGFHVCTSVLH